MDLSEKRSCLIDIKKVIAMSLVDGLKEGKVKVGGLEGVVEGPRDGDSEGAHGQTSFLRYFQVSHTKRVN